MRTAIITGSGRKRVGYEIAKHLALQGFQIAIHYHRSAESARENVAELECMGVRAEAFQADVSNESEVRDLMKQVADGFGSIDALVTTASIWKTIPLRDVSAEDVLRSFQINTLGTFLCCKYAGEVMVGQQTGGSIITIGDALIAHPYVDHAAYFTAKGSIPTLTKTFAVELSAMNPKVRVNCIQPGPVMLPEDLSDEACQNRIESTLVKLADDPQVVAKTVSFLIENPMLTGVCIDLDGGRNVGLENFRRSRTA